VSFVDDKLLLERLKNSDEKAFEMLFKEYRPRLYEYVCALSGRDYHWAPEIVHETFVKVWTKRATIKPELPFWPSIRKIARNLFIDMKRKQKLRRIFLQPLGIAEPEIQPKIILIPDPADETGKNIEREELLRKIIKIVDGDLSLKCRTIFILSRFWYWENAKIAESLEISKKTVENQLYHALKIIKKETEKR